MRALTERETFGNSRSLIAREHGAGVRQSAIVGEAQVGWAVVDRVIRDTVDTEFSRDVISEGEERNRLVAIAAEAVAQRIDGAGGEVVCPGNAAVDPAPFSGIHEAKQVGAHAVAILNGETPFQPVLAIQSPVHARAQIIAV